MRAKLTTAQAEVLKAYRDNGLHNHPQTAKKLIDAGYLAPAFDEVNKRWELALSRSGFLVLEAFEQRVMSQAN